MTVSRFTTVKTINPRSVEHPQSLPEWRDRLGRLHELDLAAHADRTALPLLPGASAAAVSRRGAVTQQSDGSFGKRG